jgi:hypothetical protein
MPAKTLEKKTLLNDSFQVPKDTCWKIVEEAGNPSGKVDGEHVLARVSGPFFLVDGVSLNNRFYSRQLWERTISKIKEKLENGGLPGTIGHEQPLDEKALLDGKVSHLVTNLWIDEKNNIGMGELLVLGTESGKHLNTYLRAGLPLPVSSRAYGKITGEGPDGADLIDEDSFILEGFDVVVSPGVPSAYPKVVEHKAEEEQTDMNEQLDKLSKEKLELTEKLVALVAENAKNEAIAKSATDEKAKLEEKLNQYKAVVKSLKEGLMKFLTLEPFKQLADEYGLLQTGGLPAGEMVKKLAEMAPKAEKFIKPEEVAGIKEKLSKFEALGSIAEIEAGAKLLETFVKLGSPSDVTARIKRAKKIETKLLEVRRKAAAAKIGKALDFNPSVIEEMLKTMTVKTVISNLRKLRESADMTARYEVSESKASKPSLSIVKGGQKSDGSLAASMLAGFRC